MPNLLSDSKLASLRAKVWAALPDGFGDRESLNHDPLPLLDRIAWAHWQNPGDHHWISYHHDLRLAHLEASLDDYDRWLCDELVPPGVKAYLLVSCWTSGLQASCWPTLSTLAALPRDDRELYSLRICAIESLGRVTPSDPNIVSQLKDLIRDDAESDKTRVAALMALGRCAAFDPELALRLASFAENPFTPEVIQDYLWSALLLSYPNTPSDLVDGILDRIVEKTTPQPLRFSLVESLCECWLSHPRVVDALITAIPLLYIHSPTYVDGPGDIFATACDDVEGDDPHHVDMAYPCRTTETLVDNLPEALRTFGANAETWIETLASYAMLQPCHMNTYALLVTLFTRMATWSETAFRALEYLGSHLPSTVVAALQSHAALGSGLVRALPIALDHQRTRVSRKHRSPQEWGSPTFAAVDDQQHKAFTLYVRRILGPTPSSGQLVEYLDAACSPRVPVKQCLERLLSLDWIQAELDRAVRKRRRTFRVRQQITHDDLAHSVLSEFTLSFIEDPLLDLDTKYFLKPAKAIHRAFDNYAVRSLRGGCIPKGPSNKG